VVWLQIGPTPTVEIPRSLPRHPTPLAIQWDQGYFRQKSTVRVATASRTGSSKEEALCRDS